MEQMRLQVWDYLVCALLLAATFSIGIYYAVVLRKRSNVSEYLFASGSMSFIPITLSILASYESALLMLGMPSEGYRYGTQFVYYDIGYLVGQVFEQVCLLTFVRRLNLISPYQYLELRFKSRPLRLLGTALGCMSILLYMSFVLYGQAIAIQTVTGFSMTASTVLTAAVAVIYTSVGGLRTVIWTDVLQIVFITGGILLFNIKGIVDTGGVYQVWKRTTLSGRFDTNTDPDITFRNNIFVFLFANAFRGLGFIFRPPVVQRITAVKSIVHARRAMFISTLLFPIFNTLALIQGLVSYSYFDVKGCDPVASKMIDSPNQIVPFMTMELFQHKPGLTGLFLAALFSATLSSMSSGLASLAYISFEDFIKPCIPSLSEFKSVLIAKVSVAVFGAVSTGLALLVSVLGRTSMYQVFVVLTSVAKNPLAALFYLGVLFPFVNTKSAFTGFLVGVSILSWLIVGAKINPNTSKDLPYPPAPTDNCPNIDISVLTSSMTTTSAPETVAPSSSGLDIFYGFSYGMYGVIGFMPVIVVGVLMGLVTGGYNEEVDKDYVISIGRNLHKCFPKRFQRYFTARYVTRDHSEEGTDIQLKSTEEYKNANTGESGTLLQ